MHAVVSVGRSVRIAVAHGARFLPTLALALLVSACGGGGGSSTSDATSPPPSGGSPSANAAPSISGSPATQATVGQSYVFTPTASDPEGASLTFSINGRPSWATFNSSTGRLSGTATAGTFANISISVSDGTNTVVLPAFAITVNASTGGSGTGSATLSWSPPTTREDGSTLTNLAGYKIYYGTDENSLDNIVSLDNPGLARYTVDGLAAGTYYFSITAVDSAGAESMSSDIASKTIG